MNTFFKREKFRLYLLPGCIPAFFRKRLNRPLAYAGGVESGGLHVEKKTLVNNAQSPGFVNLLSKHDFKPLEFIGKLFGTSDKVSRRAFMLLFFD